MTTPRIEEMVEEFERQMPLIRAHGKLLCATASPSTYKKIKDWLRQALTEAHQAGRDEALEKRPGEPTRWVSEPMTQKEAEIYVQGMYDLMVMVGCDSHCKHYDPLFFEGNTAYSYVLELDDGGRHHNYVTPQWVALKALLEFAQRLKDEWEIRGWNEYFAENTRKAIREIEALQDNK